MTEEAHLSSESRRRVPPMSAATRERLQIFADEHVNTPEFQRLLAATKRRMEEEQTRRTD